MEKLFKAGSISEGYTKVVDQTNSDLKYIEMGWLFLGKPGMLHEEKTTNKEIGMNILSGVVKLKIITGNKNHEFAEVGKRDNVFTGEPTMVYIPIDSTYHIEVLKPPFSAAVYQAPATLSFEPQLVSPQEIISVRTGQKNWTRYVRIGISNNVKAQRLLIGETIVPSGNWTSFPPHKHDEYKSPVEKPMEEIYSFHFDHPSGFAFIRLYTPESASNSFDEAYVLKDRDVISIKRGYHPIAVAPGYRCAYLFCLAGEERAYGAWSDDTAHSWIRSCETVIKGNEL